MTAAPSLPPNWKLYRLESISEIQGGLQVTSKRKPNPLEVPYLRVANVYRDSLSLDEIKTIRVTKAELDRTLLKKGDLLVVEGHGNKNEVGRTAIWDGSVSNCVHQNHLIRARFDNDLAHPGYVSMYFNSPQGRTQLLRAGKTTSGLNTINITNVKELQLPLPPLPEQRRIAAILDKADAIRRKRQETIHLTEEFLRSAFLDMFGDIPANKSRYPFGPVRPLVKANSGKSSKDVITKEATGIPIYGGNGINGWATKSLYEEPVVVIGRVGQQCGITHLTEGPAWVTDNAIVVRVTDKAAVHPVYLAAALRSSPLRARVQRLDLPFVNQSMVLDHPIPLPPLDAQLDYARLVDTTAATKRHLSEVALVTQDLFNSVVHRAFGGKL